MEICKHVPQHVYWFVGCETMVIEKIISRIRNFVWMQKRKKINKSNRERLNDRGKSASIISMNCNGGIISHDLGLQFLSPTVNLFMRADDFVKFCENLDKYLAIDNFVECFDSSIIQERTYPIAYLDDLILYLVHYKSVEEAESIWNKRKKRINKDNIIILNTDREGMTEELKDRFERLPYRKVMFTHLQDKIHPSCFYIKGYEEEPSVGIITDHNTWDGKRPIDQFDYVEFLNGNGVEHKDE